MSERVKIQQRLDDVRERFLVAIEPLPDEALLQPDAVAGMSVAVLISLRTAWEAELVTGLMRVKQGKKPDKLLRALAHPKEYERQREDENFNRDLDILFDDFQRVRLHLETWLEEFSNRDLRQTDRYPWFQGKSLGSVIAEITYQNEAKYLDALEAFGRNWSSEPLAPEDKNEE